MLIIGYEIDNGNSVSFVRLIDEKTHALYRVSYTQYYATCKTFKDSGMAQEGAFVFNADYNNEYFSPKEGWQAYPCYKDGQLQSGGRSTVMPFSNVDGTFTVVNGDGQCTSIQTVFELASLGENGAITNWYGYSVQKGKPLQCGESVESGDMVLGLRATDNVSVNKGRKKSEGSKSGSSQRKSREVNGLPLSPEEKEERKFAEFRKSFRKVCMGDSDKVYKNNAAWEVMCNTGTAVKADDIPDNFNNATEFDLDSEMTTSQFPNKRRFESAKSGAIVRVIGCNDEEKMQYGLELVNDSPDGSGTVSFTVVEPEYSHITMIDGRTAIGKKYGDERLYIINLSNSEVIDSFDKRNIYDYLVVLTASKRLLMVGVSGDDNTSALTWLVLDNKMGVKKEIVTRMNLTSYVFRKKRVYEGRIDVVDFTDRSGMGIILNMKDFSLDSKMVFSRSKMFGETAATMESIEKPEYADVTIDYSTGKISMMTNLGRNINIINGVFSNVDGFMQTFSPLLGDRITLPVEKEVQVKRHTENHKISEFRLDYDTAEKFGAFLSKFEDMTDLGQLSYYIGLLALNKGHKVTLDELITEFEPENFTEVLQSLDGKPISAMSKLLFISANNGAYFLYSYMFFHKAGSGIKMIIAKCLENGVKADKKKISLRDNEVEFLLNYAKYLENSGSNYLLSNMSLVSSKQIIDDVPNTKTFIPASVKNQFAKSSSALYSPMTTLRTVASVFSVDKAESEFGDDNKLTFFFGIGDGLDFSYKRESKSEEKTTAEHAKEYNRKFNPNEPMLKTHLGIFRVDIG